MLLFRMPVTPATALLFDQPFVMVQYPILAARLPPPALSTSKLCAANQGDKSYLQGVLNLILKKDRNGNTGACMICPL